MAVELLPVTRAADLEREPPEARWLIENLWLRNAQGIAGGQPKVGKSWLCLDFAVSVASGTPCLGKFAADCPGPALIYLAEDTIPSVRERLESICDSRGLSLDDLDVHVVTSPALRLDLEDDRLRLDATIAAYRPRLVVLDPLVRICRIDENSAAEVSGLLGFLTELVRRHDCSLVLAHHTSKKHRARPGQALRGSSDLHAWGCSNAYLTLDRSNRLTLTLEHRAAPAPEPLQLRLVSRKDGSATHFEVAGDAPDAGPVPLERRVAEQLAKTDGSLLRKDLRAQLRVNNQRLGQALERLERDGRVRRTAAGWEMAAAPRAAPSSSARSAPVSPAGSRATQRPDNGMQISLL